MPRSTAAPSTKARSQASSRSASRASSPTSPHARTAPPSPTLPRASPPPVDSTSSSTSSPNDDRLVAQVLDAKTLYDVLQVQRDATVPEIRKQYLKLSRQLHPDKCNLPRAKEAFQILSHAYHTLADEQLRFRYDQTGYMGTDNKANERTLADLASQLLHEFWSGNFENILLLVDIINATNPDLHLQKDTVVRFLKTTRSTVQEVDGFIRIVRADTIKLWELKSEFEQTPWIDLMGMLHIGIRAVQVPLIVALAVNDRRPLLFNFLVVFLSGTLGVLRAAEKRVSESRVALKPLVATVTESIVFLYALFAIPLTIALVFFQFVHTKVEASISASRLASSFASFQQHLSL